MEKRHNCKTIRNLKTENNIRVSKDTEILQEVKTFYESLYSSKIDLNMSNGKEDSFFPENNKIKLTHNQKMPVLRRPVIRRRVFTKSKDNGIR